MKRGKRKRDQDVDRRVRDAGGTRTLGSATLAETAAIFKQMFLEVERIRRHEAQEEADNKPERLSGPEKVIRPLLKAPRPEELFVIEEKIPAFWTTSLVAAVDAALADGYRRGKAFNFAEYSDGRKPPVHRWVKVLPSRKKRLLVGGFQPAWSRDGAGFIIHLKSEELLEKDNVVEVMSRQVHAKRAEKLLESVLRHCYEKSILRGRKISAAGEFVEIPERGWGDLILDDGIISEVEDNVVFQMKRMKEIESLGIPPTRGLLLEGPPGVGKTSLGQVLASELDCTFIFATPKDLRNGDSVAALFKNARTLAPTILFIEDVDLIIPPREDFVIVPEVLSEVLNQMDGITRNRGIITILTSNRPVMLEKAVADRPGRIDRRIQFGPPDAGMRKRIISLFVGRKTRLADDVDLDDVVAKTDGFTGAHLYELVRTAAVEAMKDSGRGSAPGRVVVARKHLSIAMTKIRREMEKYKEGYA